MKTGVNTNTRVSTYGTSQIDVRVLGREGGSAYGFPVGTKPNQATLQTHVTP